MRCRHCYRVCLSTAFAYVVLGDPWRRGHEFGIRRVVRFGHPVHELPFVRAVLALHASHVAKSKVLPVHHESEKSVDILWSRSVSSKPLRYCSVTFKEECPSACEISATSQPFRCAMEAKECRATW